jgi:hypothetical protein
VQTSYATSAEATQHVHHPCRHSTVVPVRTSSQTVTKSVSAAVSHRGFLGASAPVPVIPPSASGLLGSGLSSVFCSSGRPAAVSMPSTPASGDGAGLFLMPVGGVAQGGRSALSAQRSARGGGCGDDERCDFRVQDVGVGAGE